MKLIDNFLEEKEFNHLRDSMIGKDYPYGLHPSSLPWFYNDIIDNPEEERSKFQFIHTFFDDKQPRSGAFQEFAPIFKNIVGGEIHEYTKLQADSREEAIQRMIEDANTLGADAVVSVRLTTSMVTQGAAEILAYGTAVKLK